MKQAVSYYWKNVMVSFLITFVTMVAIVLFTGIFLERNQPEPIEYSQSISVTIDYSYSVSGFEVAYMIFMLIWGITAFRAPFYFFQQNAITRKIQYAAWGIAAVGIALLESLLCIACGRLSGTLFHYESVFNQMYESSLLSFGEGSIILQEILWNFSFFLLMGCAGFAIALLYYRLSKIGKVLVSVLVPGFLFVLLPMADKPLLKGGYTWLLEKAAILFSGYTPTGVQIMLPVLTTLVCSILLGCAGWMMIRRAEIR